MIFSLGMGQNASLLHEMLGEHKYLGSLNMFGTKHDYVEMKKAAIVKLLDAHVKDASIYYIVTNSLHKYDLCVAIFEEAKQHICVIHIEDHIPMDADPETTGEMLLRSVLPKGGTLPRLAFVDTTHGMCVLVDMVKVQLYLPRIESEALRATSRSGMTGDTTTRSTRLCSTRTAPRRP